MSWTGSIVSIHISPRRARDLQSVEHVRAVPRQGLKGDRFFTEADSSDPVTPDHEVTLIELEAIDALKAEYGVSISPGQARRNIVTKDVPLNHLVGKQFNVGKVKLRGIRLCEPCGHLAKLTEPKVSQGLIHRGGLRAQILTEGTIHVGDEVLPAD